MPRIDEDKKSNLMDRAAKNLPTDHELRVVKQPHKKRDVSNEQKPSGDSPRNRSKPKESRSSDMEKRLEALKNKGKISKYSIT